MISESASDTLEVAGGDVVLKFRLTALKVWELFQQPCCRYVNNALYCVLKSAFNPSQAHI